MSLLVMHYGLEFFAKRTPDKNALIYGDASLSFRDLSERSNKIANHILKSGLEKGDKVAALLDNCLEYAEIIYGCSKSGSILVPINFRLTAKEALNILQHSNSKYLFISKRIYDQLGATLGDYESLLKSRITVIDHQKSNDSEYLKIISSESREAPRINISERDTFCLGYTSGTTGQPKGAVISHRSRALMILALAVEYGLSEKDVNLTPGAIYHAAPIIFMLGAINIGSTTVIMPEFDAEKMLKMIDVYKITNAFVAPTMLQLIHQLPDEIKGKNDLTSMRAIVSAGAPLSTSAKMATEKLFGNNVLNEFYGSTEAGWNTNLKPEDQLKKPRSCGKPTYGWEVILLNDNHEKITAPGEVGEIFVRGDYIFDGYLNNEDATKNAFHEDWFSAGDLGEWDDEGYLYVVGRKKDMIITGGANVYPEEIENCLIAYEPIKDVAVIGTSDETWGELVTAVVKIGKDDLITEKDIADFCKDRIANYKRPRRIIVVDEIPRNPSGKILKNLLREKYK